MSWGSSLRRGVVGIECVEEVSGHKYFVHERFLAWIGCSSVGTLRIRYHQRLICFGYD
jgi:hypothetical protein